MTRHIDQVLQPFGWMILCLTVKVVKCSNILAYDSKQITLELVRFNLKSVQNFLHEWWHYVSKNSNFF